MNVGARILRLALASALCGAFGACHKVPDEVIQPDDMAELLADLNTGEAVVDANRRYYPSESDRAAFKEAIYARHGVTGEQVDSSLAWYGRNIKLYIDVCDKSIGILEERMIVSGNRIAEANALAVSGDSVDVWPFPRFIHISPQSPTRTIAFNFTADDNWDPGDSYTWRGKFSNISATTDWGIVAEYPDGMSETLQSTFSSDGWQEITFYTDTIHPAARIYGYLTFSDKAPHVFADSISIVRKRFNPALFSQHYRQRKLKNIEGRLHPAIVREEHKDSVR